MSEMPTFVVDVSEDDPTKVNISFDTEEWESEDELLEFFSTLAPIIPKYIHEALTQRMLYRIRSEIREEIFRNIRDSRLYWPPFTKRWVYRKEREPGNLRLDGARCASCGSIAFAHEGSGIVCHRCGKRFYPIDYEKALAESKKAEMISSLGKPGPGRDDLITQMAYLIGAKVRTPGEHEAINDFADDACKEIWECWRKVDRHSAQIDPQEFFDLVAEKMKLELKKAREKPE